MKSAAPVGSSAAQEQIDRILRSSTFANKRQLRKLLEVLFKHIDSQEQLSPELIIRELWPEEVRTKRSADVATEINRLRNALESYYHGEGNADPITIGLPNRSVTAVDGTQEKMWIIARPRSVEEKAPDRPVRVSRSVTRVMAIVASTVVLAVASYVAFRFALVHDPPAFGRMDGSTLTIMNADGRELWKKFFPAGFASDWYYDKGIANRIWFGDLEGSGHTDVLFLYAPVDSQGVHSSTLICYSDRGNEKWRWTPGRDLPEMSGSPATFRAVAVRVLKSAPGTPRRIVVASTHDTWWPSQIALVDANGKTISEYWHSGGLGAMILADLDGNGKEDIIATGASEYDHQATLVVLDPDRVFGSSTETRPGFQIHGMGVAQEKFRLLFPRSDLNRALFQFNAAIDPTVEHGKIRLTVAECITPTLGCRIYYEFDRSFQLIAAYAGGDEFRSAHERFYQTGKNAHTLSAEEQAAFLKVRCLVGCQSEFVPVGNLVP